MPPLEPYFLFCEMALAKMALQGAAMALTDTAIRELHKRAKKGDKVPMNQTGSAKAELQWQ